MIDIKDGNEKEGWIMFFCEECEQETGVRVEFKMDYSCTSKVEFQKRLQAQDRFWKTHESCGEKQLQERLDKYNHDPGDEKLRFCQSCYAEDLKMPFEDVQKRWLELSELKSEWRREHQ